MKNHRNDRITENKDLRNYGSQKLRILETKDHRI